MTHTDPVAALKARQPEHEFLIAIDSDGCAFDTMEIKQKECFIPAIVKHWRLQAISKYVRETAEFVNLYSKSRGVNRFLALTETFDLLENRPEVRARGVEIPKVPNLHKWIATESKLGNPTLTTYCATHDEPDMHQTLAWSEAINDSVKDIVQGGLPPFPFVRECLEKAAPKADLMVCSQTPQEALITEWTEQKLADYVFAICGQEQGKKAEHIQFAAEGRFDKAKILMIGDAPGDQKAAVTNGAFFFPINPGEEEASWKALHDEGLDRFFNGTFAGAYQQSLNEKFDACLPEKPRWRTCA